MQERYGKRENHSHRLEEDQIAELLKEIGLDAVTDTTTHFLLYCPFHTNCNTTSATVAKENGYFYCFGAGCNVHMSLLELVKKIRGIGTFPALRFIKRFESDDLPIKTHKEVFAGPEDFTKFDEDLLQKMQDDFWETPRAKNYVKSRGISRHSAELFGLAYDKANDMVVTPMFDTNGTCVGIIERSIEGKRFKNSYGLPTSHTLFGIHIAKRQSTDKVVICESNFDAILSHQSGHPAVATLGGTFNDYHLTQLARSFSKVVIGVDVDEAGNKFAKRIAKACKNRGLFVYRIQFDQFNTLPHGAKDFGDCTMDEIAQSVRNAVPFVLD